MRIAVFQANWIGDVVMATPAVAALRALHPAAELVSVHRPYVGGVLEGLNWFGREIAWNPRGPREQRSLAVIRQLRALKIDVAVLFPNSFRAAIVARLGGCKRRIGYARYGRSLLLTDALPPVRDGKGKIVPAPIIDAYNVLAETAGAIPARRMQLATTPADERMADRVWAARGLNRYREVVLLNPGAAFGASKHWPAEQFAGLAQSFADRRGAGVVVLCGPGERDLARDIAGLAGRFAVTALGDDVPLSLGLTKALVRRCDLLVTTDSGPRHFAAAFDRPVVTLFGPTHIGWTETYFAKAVHLQKPVDCGPCQLRRCPLDHRCMRGLSADEVFQAAERLLLRCPAPSREDRHAG